MQVSTFSCNWLGFKNQKMMINIIALELLMAIPRQITYVNLFFEISELFMIWLQLHKLLNSPHFSSLFFEKSDTLRPINNLHDPKKYVFTNLI